MTKACDGVKKFVFGLWRVPLSSWSEGFFGSMMFLTFFWQLGGGRIEQLQNNIMPAQIFLLLGTLFSAWLWLDEDGGSDE